MKTHRNPNVVSTVHYNTIFSKMLHCCKFWLLQMLRCSGHLDTRIPWSEHDSNKGCNRNMHYCRRRKRKNFGNKSIRNKSKLKCLMSLVFHFLQPSSNHATCTFLYPIKYHGCLYDHWILENCLQQISEGIVSIGKREGLLVLSDAEVTLSKLVS